MTFHFFGVLSTNIAEVEEEESPALLILECMTESVDPLILFAASNYCSSLLCALLKKKKKKNSSTTTTGREIFVGLHLRYYFKSENRVLIWFPFPLLKNSIPTAKKPDTLLFFARVVKFSGSQNKQ